MAAPIAIDDRDKDGENTHQKMFPAFIERYFTTRYKPDVNGRQGEDFCILQHSNKICVLTVARGHPILRNESTVIKVDFQVSPNTNRMENKVVGKSKKGAQFLQENSALCTVHCSNGKTYTMYSCIRGKLIEVNEALVSRPQLLKDRPTTEGYIAVILLRLSDCDKQLDSLLSSERYAEILASRASELPDTVSAGGHSTDSSSDNPTRDFPT